MKCVEVNNWMEKADAQQLLELNTEVQAHVAVCNNCKEKLEVMQACYTFMHTQRQQTLSDAATDNIIKALVHESKPVFFLQSEWFSRAAAVLIIVGGVLLGLLLSDTPSVDNSGESLWSDEFSLLSDNSNYTLIGDE